MPLKGSCHCGAIQFEVTEAPTEVTELPTLLVIDGRGTLRGASTRLLGAGEIRELLEGAE